MYVSDMHTHSIASGHGTSDTIAKMAKAARTRRIRLLGITDHGPATMGSAKEAYFKSLTMAPRRRCGVEILYGIELNILDQNGRLDLPRETLSRLDYAVASMHSQTLTHGDIFQNTTGYLHAMENPKVKILGHIDTPNFPADIEELVGCAPKHHVLIELNEASLSPGGARTPNPEGSVRIVLAAKKYRTPLLLSSDSHGAAHVGDFTYCIKLLRALEFPEQLIINNQTERLKSFLKEAL